MQNPKNNTPLSPQLQQEANNSTQDTLGLVNSPIMHTNFTVNELDLQPPTMLINQGTGATFNMANGISSPKDATSSSNSTPSITCRKNDSIDDRINSDTINVINSSSNHNNDADDSGYKVDLTKMDLEVSRMLKRLETIEKNIIDLENNDENSAQLKEIHALIDHFKTTILRLNLKNTLAKNELLSVKDEYSMERHLLINKIEHLDQTLRIIQSENNAVNSRNLKLIKYIKTLKNEKLKYYITENHKLRERLDVLERQLSLNVNYPQRQPVNINSNTPITTSSATMLPSPLSVSSASQPLLIPVSMHYSRSNKDDEFEAPTSIHIHNHNNNNNNNNTDNSKTLLQSPTNTTMLETLGKLATEYLNNEYPNK
jgi:hypothetical protein